MKEIASTWISGESSLTLVIPKLLAQKAGIYQPGKVVIEDSEDGSIRIRRLEF